MMLLHAIFFSQHLAVLASVVFATLGQIDALAAGAVSIAGGILLRATAKLAPNQPPRWLRLLRGLALFLDGLMLMGFGFLMFASFANSLLALGLVVIGLYVLPPVKLLK